MSEYGCYGLTTLYPPTYYPAPSDLNLDGAGKPLTFSSAIRGPHGKEWGLGYEQELIKLLVTLKCLLPVIRPAKTPTYLKRVVKEKWDEVNRLRKRRVRWTIGGDKINVEYDVIPYDKKTRVEIECKLIRIVNSELRLKGNEGHTKPADGWSPRAAGLCLSSVLMLSIIG